MKYTKVNELEIEKKMLFDENKRINQTIQDIARQVNDQNDIER
jgi:hypothetical protein